MKWFVVADESATRLIIDRMGLDLLSCTCMLSLKHLGALTLSDCRSKIGFKGQCAVRIVCASD